MQPTTVQRISKCDRRCQLEFVFAPFTGAGTHDMVFGWDSYFPKIREDLRCPSRFISWSLLSQRQGLPALPGKQKGRVNLPWPFCFLFLSTTHSVLAATETVAAVVAQVAIAVANGDRSTAIATRGIALESSELTVARFRFRR